MKTTPLIATTLIFLSCSLAALADSSNPGYQLSTAANDQIGDKEHLEKDVSIASDFSITNNGQVVKQAKVFHSLQADVHEEILSADKGEPIVIEATFDSVNVTDTADGPAQSLDFAGKTVIVTRFPKLSFVYVDGTDVTSRDKFFLSLLYTARGPDDEADDAAINMPSSVHVGDTWTGNNDRFASMMSRQGSVTVDPGKVVSTFTASGTGTNGGVPYVEIDGDVNVTDIVPASIPPNVTVKNASATMTINTEFPTNASRLELLSKFALTVQFSGSADAGAQGTIDVDVSLKMMRTEKYLAN